MAIIYGDYSDLRSIVIAPSEVDISSITAPVASSVHSSSVTVTYAIRSYKAPETIELIFYVEFNKQGEGIDGTYVDVWVLSNVDIEYSIDGASTYSDCSEDTTDATSEGIINLSTSTSGDIHNFVWHLIKDVETNDYLTNAYIRIRASDGVSWSDYLTSSAFSIDTVPTAPAYNADSYTDGYREKDTTPEFHFSIPSDVGSDRLHFKINWDTSSTFASSDLVTKTSYSNNGFWHYHNNTSGKLGSYTINNYKKFGDWYFQIEGITTGGTYSFGDYEDYYKQIYIPGGFIDPKVIFYSEADALYYLENISTTGFTVSLTADTNFSDMAALSGETKTDNSLHTYLFEGTWGEYWISDIVVSGETKEMTFGSGDLATDDNGITIPATIETGSTIAFQSQNDALFYIDSISSTGFTINKALDIGTTGVTDSLTALILKTRTNVYYKADQAGDVAISGNDDKGEAIPSYIPGLQTLICPSTKNIPLVYNYDSFYLNTTFDFTGSTHTNASAMQANVGFFGGNADYLWIPIRSQGILDDYELEKAKFQVQEGDELTEDKTYYYRIAAGNE